MLHGWPMRQEVGVTNEQAAGLLDGGGHRGGRGNVQQVPHPAPCQGGGGSIQYRIQQGGHAPQLLHAQLLCCCHRQGLRAAMAQPHPECGERALCNTLNNMAWSSLLTHGAA